MIKPDITFALVKTFYRYGKNQYMSFLPLLVDCTQLLPGNYISINDLQLKYKDLYGLTLPQSVIKKILLVGKNEGYFIFEGELIRKTDKISASSIRKEQEKYLLEHDYIIDNFIKYYREIKQNDITYEIAEKAMFDFMDENVYKLIKNSIEKKEESISITGNENKIAFGRFIRDAIEKLDTTTTAYVSDIAKGVMIQNAVYLPNDDSIERKFSDTWLIFDTPIILSLLGYAGKEKQLPILELLDMARSSGAKIAVYDFTISEVASVLKDCADRIKNNSSDHHGKSIEYFIEQNYSYEEILVFIGKLDKDLQKYNIAILKKLNDPQNIFMDELKLEKCIDNKLQYRHKSSKLKDIDALATTYNLRHGENNIYLENSKAIFITSNFPLVMAAKDYFYDNRQHIDIAMTEFYITNILWLKKPTKYPDLPMKRVIADIYSALQPNDVIWSSFITETEAMEERGEITYEDVITLKSSSHASDLIFDASQGGINLLSPSSIKEILDEINKNREKEILDKQDKRIKDKSRKIAILISNIFSWFILIIVAIMLIIQAIDPIKSKILSNFLSFYFIGTLILFIINILNVLTGTTINIIKKALIEFIESKIFKLLKWFMK